MLEGTKKLGGGIATFGSKASDLLQLKKIQSMLNDSNEEEQAEVKPLTAEEQFVKTLYSKVHTQSKLL